MTRYARVRVPEEQLDEIHDLKRRLGRERGARLSLDDVFIEALELLLRHYGKLPTTKVS